MSSELYQTIELIGREKGLGFFRSRHPKWTLKVPVRAYGMVLSPSTSAGQAAGNLFIAGPPDVVPADDPLAAFEGRLGAWLWVVSADAGK